MKQGYKRKVIQEKLGLKIDALNKYIRFVKDNLYLIENGRVEDVIHKTMELSKINKSIKYGILIANVKKKLEEIQKGKLVMVG